MNDVAIVLGAAARLELHLGPKSSLLRDHVGMTAWVALEALVFAAVPDSRGAVTVATSARDLAGRLGIGKDRAAAALAVLRDAGLLVLIVSSAGRSGRFTAHRYEIRLPVSRSPDAAQAVGRERRPSEVRRTARDGARLFELES